MRSHDELLEASGYANRPRDFDDLIRILDGEIRLITPTDPEGNSERLAGRRTAPGPEFERHSFYQLTHDYLVPSLREWLTRKQKETRRGRAELLLADRAAVWNGSPENRQLPALWQWLQHPLADAEEDLDAAAAEDDAAGGPVSRCRGVVLAVLLAVVVVAGMAVWDQVVERHNADRAAGLVDHFLDADIDRCTTSSRRWGRTAAGPTRCFGASLRRGRAGKGGPANGCTPAWPCCRWTPARWTTCTAGCSTRNPRKWHPREPYRSTRTN